MAELTSSVSNGIGEILLYDSIGPEWAGLVSSSMFAAELASLGSISRLNLRINSNGGDVFQAMAMYNVVKNHNARVIVHVDGVAASAASVIAMAGDYRHIAENAFVMIHDPIVMVEGGHEEMARMSDLLASTKQQMTSIYAARTGLNQSTIADMMSAETWMDSEDAKRNRFVDTIDGNKAIAASVDAHWLHNVPDVLKRRDVPASPNAAKLAAAKQARIEAQRERAKAQTEDDSPKVGQYRRVPRRPGESDADWVARMYGRTPTVTTPKKETVVKTQRQTDIEICKRWNERVDAETAKHGSKAKAVAAIVKDSPDVQRGYLAAYGRLSVEDRRRFGN